MSDLNIYLLFNFCYCLCFLFDDDGLQLLKTTNVLGKYIVDEALINAVSHS